MSLSKKRAPRVSDPQLNRIITQLYDDMNEVINAVNQGDTSTERESFEGKSGDLRLAKDSTGSYEIQGKSNEGWVSAGMNFKEK